MRMEFSQYGKYELDLKVGYRILNIQNYQILNPPSLHIVISGFTYWMETWGIRSPVYFRAFKGKPFRHFDKCIFRVVNICKHKPFCRN